MGSREHPGTHQPVTPLTFAKSLSFRSRARLTEGNTFPAEFSLAPS